MAKLTTYCKVYNNIIRQPISINITEMIFVNYLTYLTYFLLYFYSEICRNQSEQVSNGPFKGVADGLSYFSFIFSYFFFFWSVIPDIEKFLKLCKKKKKKKKKKTNKKTDDIEYKLSHPDPHSIVFTPDPHSIVFITINKVFILQNMPLVNRNEIRHSLTFPHVR